jgi:hypothetical protein
MRLLILAVIFLGGCANYGEMTPEQRAYMAASVGQSLQNYGAQMQDTARMQSYIAQQGLIQQQYQPAYAPVFNHVQPYQSTYQWTPIPVSYIPSVR